MKAKRIASLLLSLVLTACTAAVAPSASAAQIQSEETAASGTTGDCRWSLSGTVLTISGSGRMKDYSYFYNTRAPWGTDITEVIINHGVTYIGKDAFTMSDNLTTVHFPSDSLVEIGEAAFDTCKSLNNLVIPDTVETIDSYAFAACHSLTDITLSKNLTTLYGGTFSNCSSLEHIELPDSLTEIKWETFRFCSKLKSVRLPANLKAIRSDAFEGCSSLEAIELPESLELLDDEAFRHCYALAGVNFPAGITEFGTDIFERTAWLDNQPDGPIYINQCLLDWKGECPAEITVKDGTKKIYGIKEKTALVKVNLPNSLTKLGSKVFYGCTALTDVTIPYGVTALGSSAFRDCTALTELIMPDSITELGGIVCQNCTALEKLHISENVTSVGYTSFDNCTSLKEVIIPQKLQKLEHCFENCTSLEKVLLMAPNFWGYNSFTGAPELIKYRLNPADNYRVELNGSVLTISGEGATVDYSADDPMPLTLFPELADRITAVVVEEGMTAVGDCFLADFKNLKSISLPSTVTRIGGSAFEDCVSLVELPDLSGVTYMGSHSLDGTAWLDSQPDGAVYAGDIFYCWKGECPSLVSVGARVVAAGALSGSETLRELQITAGVEHINSGAVCDCPNMTAAGFFTDTCGIESGAFMNCPQLVFYCNHGSTAHAYAKENSIVFRLVSGTAGDCRWTLTGTKLTVFGSGSLPSENGPWHSDVTEIILGKGVTKVGSSAFSNLSGLKRLVVQSRTTSFEAFALPTGKAIDVYCYKGSTAESKLKSGLFYRVTIHYLGEKGDANIDGRVDVNDATFLQTLLAEFDNDLLTIDDGDVIAQGDVNNDGVLNIYDVTTIQRYLAGMTDTLG